MRQLLECRTLLVVAAFKVAVLTFTNIGKFSVGRLSKILTWQTLGT